MSMLWSATRAGHIASAHLPHECLAGLPQDFLAERETSMLPFDRLLQSQLSGKRRMKSIWAAVEWNHGVLVTRHEARLRRPVVGALGLAGEVRSCLDGPWECLTHLQAIFAAVVVQAAAEACPDA